VHGSRNWSDRPWRCRCERSAWCVHTHIQGVPVHSIYASPALRCVQTAGHLCAQLDGHLRVCIEPGKVDGGFKLHAGFGRAGLFEPHRFYDSLPEHMSPQSLLDFGLPIDTNYA